MFADLATDCILLSKRTQSVHICPEGLERTIEALVKDPPAPPTWIHPSFPSEAGPRLDAVVWLGNALNFCYWVDPGRPMWSVEVDGEPQVDAFAIFGALKRAFEEGIDLLDGRTLAAYAHSILDLGHGDLPLYEERVEILQEIGTIVALQFGGSLELAVRAAGRDAHEHASALGTFFPSFRDSRRYQGIILPFLKRAQLAAGMLHCARTARGAQGLTGTEQLTLYADYMLPRTLRALGVLRYQPGLAARVDTGQQLLPQSPDETEIRIATVAAGELLISGAQKAGATLDVLSLDHWLWRRGLQLKTPHHRTRTTDY